MVTSPARHMPLAHGMRLALSASFLPRAIVLLAPSLPVHQLLGLLCKWCCWAARVIVCIQHSCGKPVHGVLLHCHSFRRRRCVVHRCLRPVDIPQRLWWSRHLVWDQRLWFGSVSNQSLAWTAPAATNQALTTCVVALLRSSAATFVWHDAIPDFLDVGGWACRLVCPGQAEPHLKRCIDGFIR